MSSIDYKNENTLICTIARMNPPTPGHLYVIRKLIEEANRNDIDHVYVILSKKNDDNKNPITCEEKKQVLGEGDYLSTKEISTKMINSLKSKMIQEVTASSLEPTQKVKIISQIENIYVNLICVPDTKGATPFTPIYPLIQKLKNASPSSCPIGVNLFLIIGEDRIDMLHALSSYYFKMDEVNSVDGRKLPRSETEECASSADQVILSNVFAKPEMSATNIRDLVKNGDFDTFNDIYKPYLDPINTQRLFSLVLEGIKMKSPVDANTQSKSSTKKKLSPLPFPHVKKRRGGCDYNKRRSQRKNS